MPARDQKCRAYKLKKSVRDARYRRSQYALGWFVGLYVARVIG